MQDQKLMDYFKFDEGDLQANRNGQVTEKQKARMIKDSKSAESSEIRLLFFSCSSASLGLSLPLPQELQFRIGPFESVSASALAASGRWPGAASEFGPCLIRLFFNTSVHSG